MAQYCGSVLILDRIRALRIDRIRLIKICSTCSTSFTVYFYTENVLPEINTIVNYYCLCCRKYKSTCKFCFSNERFFTKTDKRRAGRHQGCGAGTGTGTGRNRIHLGTLEPEPEPHSEYGSGSEYKEMKQTTQKN